ncbi:MAG: FkbM family methyltransferase, partial [Candidatus Omnitrophica bacterium]|nr:FkbM family methyltransferase [Candidatus Omnitrophota bacterium]
ERATPEVKAEIDALFDTKEENQVVYWIPRKNYIGDHWLQYGGWYPAPHMKLYNRKYFRWKECVYDVVHPGNEFIEPGYKKGPNLKNHLIHHNYKNVEDFIKKTNRLTTLDAIKWYLDGRQMSLGRAFRRTIDRFLRRYIRKKGYKDGYYGFISSALSGFYELAAYSKLREIRQRGYYLKENGITEDMIASAPLFAEPSGWRKFVISFSALPTAWKTAWRNIKGQKFESEVEIVRKLVQPGYVCLDAGGAYGRYTYALARATRNVKVLVFEPVRFNCAVLRQIKALFWLGSVEIEKLVLGDRKGKIYAASPVKKSGKVGYNLSYTSETVVPNAVCERVDMDTIDAVLLSKNVAQLDIIICDTEGSELRVMQG